MAINETKQYTELLPSGKAWQFFFPQEVKSFITRPSPGLTLKGPGFYEISGLAYSGNGPINKVEVSADGGKSWALAALDAPVLSKSFTRFRIALELEWSAGDPAKPCDGRGRQRSTDAGGARGGARRVQSCSARNRGPGRPHQCDHKLGDEPQWRGESCLCMRGQLHHSACTCSRLGNGRSR